MNINSELKITDFHSEWTCENVKLDPHIDSMIFIDQSNTYIYSDAVIYLFAAIHPLFKPILFARVIPKRIRDVVYQFVAKRRRNIVKNQSCPLMSQKAKKMFLP